MLTTVYSSTLNTLFPKPHSSSGKPPSVHQMSVHLCVWSVLFWCRPDANANHFAVFEVEKLGKLDKNGAYRACRKHCTCKSICLAWLLTASPLSGCKQSRGCTVEPLGYSCSETDTSLYWSYQSVHKSVLQLCCVSAGWCATAHARPVGPARQVALAAGGHNQVGQCCW